MSFQRGQLVLYLEEIEVQDNDENSSEYSSSAEEEKIDRSNYVLYDHDCKEYFITGIRKDDDAVEYKFYAKKAVDIYSFLINTIDENSLISIILFNYVDIYANAPIYDNHPYLDYNTLDEKSEEKGIIISSFYELENDNFHKILTMLKLLKTIRY